MARSMIARPDETEYAPFYAGYVARVPNGDLHEILRSQIYDTVSLVGSLGEAEAAHRYATGKWSIKDVIGHVADTERVMGYRALCFSRGETAPLPGFDENLYVANARFDARPLADLIEELRSVREATVHLFAHLNEEELARRGVANGREVSVRALAWIIAGHERHHAAILRERYLPSLAGATPEVGAEAR
jgi:hypothetical protein